MSSSPPSMFLSDDTFELLVRVVPNEVIRGLDVLDFEQAVGLSRTAFEDLVNTLGAEGRTQGFIGMETATYLRNALGITVLAFDPGEFQTRTGFERSDALTLLQELSRRTGLATGELA